MSVGKTLDIVANRSARKWSMRELVGRALWEVLRAPLFAWTPRPLWGWRRAVLRFFGAEIGRRVNVFPTVKIAVPWNLSIHDEASVGDGVVLYSLGRITIGRQASISQFAHLCAGSHDYRRPDLPLTKPPVMVGEGAWICADAFVGPGVTIGDFAVVAARAVAVKDVAAWSIVAGNPARLVRMRPPFAEGSGA